MSECRSAADSVTYDTYNQRGRWGYFRRKIEDRTYAKDIDTCAGASARRFRQKRDAAVRRATTTVLHMPNLAEARSDGAVACTSSRWPVARIPRRQYNSRRSFPILYICVNDETSERQNEQRKEPHASRNATTQTEQRTVRQTRTGSQQRTPYPSCTAQGYPQPLGSRLRAVLFHPIARPEGEPSCGTCACRPRRTREGNCSRGRGCTAGCCTIPATAGRGPAARKRHGTTIRSRLRRGAG